MPSTTRKGSSVGLVPGVGSEANMPTRWLAPALVVALTAGLTAATVRADLTRYRALETGWSWDLAYYNQWCWSLTRGDGTLSVRPVASYAIEGPRALKMNYLAPIRFALLPLYRIWPDPRLLLIVNAGVFWWLVPACYGLAVAESGSRRVGLVAASLSALTPLAWPLAVDDFRELQLAVPFVIWGVRGFRERSRSYAILGVVGMLACRQELAVAVCLLAIVPPRRPEDLGKTYAWSRVAILVGVGWLLLFLVYLKVVVGPMAGRVYLDEMAAGGPSTRQVAETSAELLAVGLGSWALLAFGVPRLGLIVAPWVYSVANGRWAAAFLATEQWQQVRYTAPMVATSLAAGVVGYARVTARLRGRWANWAFHIALIAGLVAPTAIVQSRLARVSRPFPAADVDAFWAHVPRVGPGDGVLAAYELSAPLSSRRILSSYVLEMNRPKGFPRLEESYRWVFIKTGDFGPQIFTDQGFARVHDGHSIRIYHRFGPAKSP